MKDALRDAFLCGDSVNMTHSNKNEISRFGAYGILLQNSAILLTRKKSGPYKGLWDLPGGAIEFAETPEEALKRELLEESALSIVRFEFATTATAVGDYEDDGVPYRFHHVGMIYKVTDWTQKSDLVPEEENRWAQLNGLHPDELTPLAQQAVASLVITPPKSNTTARGAAKIGNIKAIKKGIKRRIFFS